MILNSKTLSKALRDHYIAVAKTYGLSPHEVEAIYNGYWAAVKDIIKERSPKAVNIHGLGAFRNKKNERNQDEDEGPADQEL
jgi:hypothetical protein|nr:MAG TPA: IHF host factor [Crassvirales sp.]